MTKFMIEIPDDKVAAIEAAMRLSNTSRTKDERFSNAGEYLQFVMSSAVTSYARNTEDNNAQAKVAEDAEKTQEEAAAKAKAEMESNTPEA